MKKVWFFASLFIGLSLSVSAQKVLTSWVSPDYVKVDYRKIAVVARIPDKKIQKMVENDAVSFLRDKGINAVASNLSFSEGDSISYDSLIKKTESLKADAVIMFSILSEDSKIQNGRNINAGVGIPISIGFFTAYIGGNIPLGGSPRYVEILQLKSELHNQRNKSLDWYSVYEFKLRTGYETVSQGWTKKTISTLFKAKIL
jgi:hypothetical protein